MALARSTRAASSPSPARTSLPTPASSSSCTGRRRRATSTPARLLFAARCHSDCGCELREGRPDGDEKRGKLYIHCLLVHTVQRNVDSLKLSSLQRSNQQLCMNASGTAALFESFSVVGLATVHILLKRNNWVVGCGTSSVDGVEHFVSIVASAGNAGATPSPGLLGVNF